MLLLSGIAAVASFRVSSDLKNDDTNVILGLLFNKNMFHQLLTDRLHVEGFRLCLSQGHETSFFLLYRPPN